MRRSLFAAMLLILAFSVVEAQTKINPGTDIRWPNGAAIEGLSGYGNGDSITADCPNVAGGECYVQFLEAATGNTFAKGATVPALTEANAGDQLMDQIQHVFSDPPAVAADNSFMLIGQNDASSESGLLYYPWQLNGQWWWQGALRAAYLWRLAPNWQSANGTPIAGNASTATPSGTWAASTTVPAAVNAYGRTTSTAGSTLTFHVVGTAVYALVMETIDAYPNLTIQVDANAPKTYANYAQVNWHTVTGPGRPSSCPGVPSYAACTSPYAIRIGGLNYADHQVTITYSPVAAPGNAPLTVLAVTGNAGQLTATGPYMYGAYPYQDMTTPNVNYEYLVANIRDTAEELEGDGLGMSVVDLRGACYTGGNVYNCTNPTNNPHPNTVESQVIANAFATQMGVFGTAPIHGVAARSTSRGLAGVVGSAMAGYSDVYGEYPHVFVGGINGALFPSSAPFIGANAQGQAIISLCGQNFIVGTHTVGGANPSCIQLNGSEFAAGNISLAPNDAGGVEVARATTAGGAQNSYLQGTTTYWQAGLRAGDSNYHLFNYQAGADAMACNSATSVCDFPSGLSVNEGANVVYRCTAAGALPVGALTVVASDCGSSTPTSLKLN